MQTSLVAGSIEKWGTEEQKQKWLPRMCTGEALGCFGLTEPDTGSDAANLRTRATKTDSGWSISGQKMWISLANFSEVALIFAQTDPEKKHKGLACFLVPTDSEGFSTQEIHGKLGLRSSDTGEISLDNVEVGEDAMLGEIGDGFKVAMSALDNGRYSVAAGCVGICEGCVEASVAYSKERKQFGVPLARFQLVQEMIADMILKRDASRMLVYRAGVLKDEGKPNTMETSVAKLYATESAVECANLAIQVHGGSGYVDDYPVERYLRDARVTTLYEGTSQIQKLIIGRAATGSQRDDADGRGGIAALPELIEISRDGHVALLQLNRPEARNALSPEMMEEIAATLEALDPDPDIRCIVIAGSEKVFAAGADIKAMSERSFAEALRHPAASFWRRVAAIKTPLIAAVSGYALGGGCELALTCDMIVASDTALFGQPEITLGIIPGGGGTQRLARVLGKQRAMEYVLTGRRFDAEMATEDGPRQQGGRERQMAAGGDGPRPDRRRTAADRGAPRQAGRARRRGDLARRRPRERASPLRAGDGDRGPGRGHEGLPREARAEVRGQVKPADGPQCQPIVHDFGPSAVECVGVVGAGTMGAGIAQIAALGGYETRLHDPVPEALEAANDRLHRALAKGATKGLWSEEEADLAGARVGAAVKHRRPGRMRPGDRGRARGPGAEARALRLAGRRLRTGDDPRQQHLLAAGDGDRRPGCPTPSASSACTSSTRRR